jgi:hypothetical protein
MKRLLILLVLSLLALSSTAYSQQRPKAKKSPTPCPGVVTIADCPEEGCGQGSDPELNKRKNIRADPQQPALKTIEWMKDLPDPEHFTAKNRNRDELKELGEGQKITVVAWALAARKGGRESCNCKLGAKADTDNHIVLVDPDLDEPTLALNEKRDSVTAEFSPRTRLDHPNFTQEKLEPLIDPDWRPSKTATKGKLRVRVTGLLMFDSEHFLRNPLKRFNDWEIHPVLKMEFCPEEQTCEAEADANWKNLDDE